MGKLVETAIYFSPGIEDACLIDLFAAAALAGYLASGEAPSGPFHEELHPDMIASHVWEIALAVMKRRTRA